MNLYLITAFNSDGEGEVEIIRAQTATAAMELWPWQSQYVEGPDIFFIPQDGPEGVVVTPQAAKHR